MWTAKKIQSLIGAALLATTAGVLVGGGCAPASDTLPDGAGSSGTGIPEGEGICLMNNCSSDDECGGCDDGRDACLVAENRCIACDPNTGSGCDPGYTCSPYGICAPDGQTCSTDDRGEPTFDCSVDDDCLACSPMHQVCDSGTKRCTACTSGDTTHCLQSDVCVAGKCSSKCPTSCSTDNDCGQCGGAGKEAHACNAHKCGQCSTTYPCPAGLECKSGSCVPQCGTPGPNAGDCINADDCKFCGDGKSAAKWECKKPINQSGPNDHGSCGPKAAGCTDLGTNVAVLPGDWGNVTNLCSTDNDCNGVGITYNVGKAIRDIIGSDKINLGFIKVSIHDANIQYDMSKCADIDITNNISCGVCVPCKIDSDCQPIQIDPLLADLFKGEPLAQIAGSLLLDLLFGNNNAHQLNFHCQAVAAGYGVCTPCANPLQACGQNQGGGGGGGSCTHSVCATGGPLGSTCDSCAALVCAQDPYCCNTGWDSTCVGEVAQYCGSGTCSGGGSNCAHSECTAGAKLTASCSTCATTVCNADSYCCNTQWDSICVGLANQHCTGGCSGGNETPPPSTCAHSECTAGAKLTASCSQCAADVCGQDSYCCSSQWDSICVDIAGTKSSCGC